MTIHWKDPPEVVVPVFVIWLIWQVIGRYFVKTPAQKRTEALFDLALSLGLSFDGNVSGTMFSAVGSFDLFALGDSRSGANLMRGKADGLDVAALDFSYATGATAHRWDAKAQTVVVLPGGRDLPDFDLCPEKWWLQITGGQHDIDFDTSQEFSRLYQLNGPDEARIRAAFGPRTLKFFADNPGWSVESRGGRLAIYRANEYAVPERMKTFIAEAVDVRAALIGDGR